MGDWKNYILRTSNFRTLPNKRLKIKSRRIRWAGHVALVRRRAMHAEFDGKARKKENTRKT
jgi:hypothetical protein